MAYRATRWLALRINDPGAFRRVLLEAIGERAGCVTHVAEDFDVDRATIKRWIAELGVRAEVEKVRSRAKKAS